MEMEENARPNQLFEECGPLNKAQLIEIVCNALKIATEGDPNRLKFLLEKMEQIVQLNTEHPQENPPDEEGERSKEGRPQGSE